MKELNIKDFSITEDVEKFTKEVALQNIEYMIAQRNKEGEAIGYCTRCNKESLGDDIKHNSYTRCPMCNAMVQVKNKRYGRRGLWNRFLIYSFKEDTVNEGIVIETWLGKRDGYENYKEVETKYYLEAVYYLNEKFCKMYARNYQGELIERRSLFDINNIIKSVFDSDGFDTYINIDSFEFASKNSKFKYAELREMIKRKGAMREAQFMIKYLEVFIKKPIIEKLNKVNCKEIVARRIRGYSNGFINIRGKNVYSVLKLGKGELREITKSKIEITEDVLSIYRMARDNGSKMNVYEIEEVAKEFLGYRFKLETVLEKVGIKKIDKIIKYFKSQKAKRMDLYNKLNDVAIIYDDYLEELKLLNQDLDNKRILFPKDLMEEHNRTSQQVKINENKNLQDAIKERRKELSVYKYLDDDLIIRPIRNLTELIKEGKELGHCVGGYVKKHAKGETNIFVIRKREQSDIPFYTVEIQKNKIIQVRGKNNRVATEEVQAFVEKFKLEKLIEKKSKQKVIKIA